MPEPEQSSFEAHKRSHLRMTVVYALRSMVGTAQERLCPPYKLLRNYFSHSLSGTASRSGQAIIPL
jgi:hypothetical protein